MSDRRLSKLRRDWESTRTLEAEAAYLSARLRLGELSHEQLKAAADAGHLGSRFAIGDNRRPLGEIGARDPWLPLVTLSGYAAYAQVSSQEDFEWRFAGFYLTRETQGYDMERLVAVIQVLRVFQPGSLLSTVGCDPGAELQFDRFEVPPRQGEFTVKAGELVYRDLESGLTSFVDGVPLDGQTWTAVPAGSKLRLGSVSFVVWSLAELHRAAMAFASTP